jgi:hypothetical protein
MKLSARSRRKGLPVSFSMTAVVVVPPAVIPIGIARRFRGGVTQKVLDPDRVILEIGRVLGDRLVQAELSFAKPTVQGVGDLRS